MSIISEGAFEGFEEVNPPAAVHAEMTIIGAMLLEPAACHEAMELLEESDFYLESHKVIYRIIVDLMDMGEGVDTTTVTDLLIKRRQDKAMGGASYLFGLTENIPRRLSIESYVRIVRDKSLIRQTINRCSVAITRCNDGSEEAARIIEDVEADLLAITDGMRVKRFETIQDAIKRQMSVDEFVEVNFDPAKITGLRTEFIEFDKKTGGLKEDELIILAARPSMGKTAWAVNIATNVVLRDPEKVVAIFSLEMSRNALFRRMMQSVAEVSSHRATMGWLGRDERMKLANAAMRLSEMHLLVDDTTSITPMQMRAKARRLKQQMGRLDLVVVDYLQLMSSGRRTQNRVEEVGIASRSLKALAKELHVPVLAIAAIGRASEKGSDKRPGLADLRESGQIEFDADLVAFIHREEFYKPQDDEVKGLAEIIIAKQREGPTGTIELAYMGDYTRFNNLAPRIF